MTLSGGDFIITGLFHVVLCFRNEKFFIQCQFCGPSWQSRWADCDSLVCLIYYRNAMKLLGRQIAKNVGIKKD